METFTVRDLREHTGDLIHDAEHGKLSLITKRGRPVFLALPFSEELLELGIHLALAISLYKEGVLTLEKAAKVAELPIEAFLEQVGKLGISTVNYSSQDLDEELKDFD